MSGGTDNHLMLVDLSEEDVTGKELETRLDEAHITCNKNTIPNDPRSPRVTSGVRLGTPAVTTRGMKEADMDVIAGAIAMVIRDEGYVAQARRMVESFDEKVSAALRLKTWQDMIMEQEIIYPRPLRAGDRVCLIDPAMPARRRRCKR